jgi:hypothetical protein
MRSLRVGAVWLGFLPETLPLQPANLSREVYAVTKEFDLNRFDTAQIEYCNCTPWWLERYDYATSDRFNYVQQKEPSID